MVLLLLGDLHGDAAGDLLVDVRGRTVGIGDDGRHARVGLLADPDVERKLTQELDAVVLAHLEPAALAEDVLLVTALAADMEAHVLDDAEDGNADLLEHLEALAR